MRRRLLSARELGGDPAAVLAGFTGDPSRWLPEPSRRRGPDLWTVELAAGPLSRRVACRIGSPWHVDEGVWRALGWRAEAEHGDLLPMRQALPELRGELGLRRRGDGWTLMLRGRYAPPAGRLGAAADAAALHRVAVATAEHFLADVAARLRPVAGPAAPGAQAPEPTG